MALGQDGPVAQGVNPSHLVDGYEAGKKVNVKRLSREIMARGMGR